MTKKQHSLFKKTMRFVLIVFAACWVMFEEWVWDSILAVMERIGRLRIVQRFEAVLALQDKYVLLILFSVPVLIMVPAKIYGVYLITSGKLAKGIMVIVAAKSIATALVTRLFVVAKPKLLEIKQFAVVYAWIVEKKEWIYAELNRLPAWQAARRRIRELKQLLILKFRTWKRGLTN